MQSLEQITEDPRLCIVWTEDAAAKHSVAPAPAGFHESALGQMPPHQGDASIRQHAVSNISSDSFGEFRPAARWRSFLDRIRDHVVVIGSPMHNGLTVRGAHEGSQSAFIGFDIKSRGRELKSVGIWQGSGAAVVQRSLGIVYSMALDGAPASVERYKQLLADPATAIAVWTTRVDRRFLEDDAFSRGVLALVVRHFHVAPAPGLGHGTSPSLGMHREQVAGSLCGGCHSRQLYAWLASRHSAAMDTLRRLKRDHDVRCVSCHQTSRESHTSASKALGVFCNGCHSMSDSGPGGQCQNCHTGVTDPSGSWKKGLESVCASGSISPIGSCARREYSSERGGAAE